MPSPTICSMIPVCSSRSGRISTTSSIALTSLGGAGGLGGLGGRLGDRGAGTDLGERVSDGRVVAVDGDRQQPVDAALDVVDAAVHEVEVHPGTGERAEHARLRRGLVGEGDRKQTALVAGAQRGELL